MKQIKDIKTISQQSAVDFDSKVKDYLEHGYSIYGQPFSKGNMIHLMMVLLEDDPNEPQTLLERLQ